MSGQSDLGPVLPPRMAVYGMAVELQALARIAVDLSCTGHRVDIPRALKQFDKMRAILGSPPAAEVPALRQAQGERDTRDAFSVMPPAGCPIHGGDR